MRQSPGHELHKSLVLKGPRPLPPFQSRNSVEKFSATQHFRDESIRSNVAQFAIDMTSSNPHSRNGSSDSKTDGKLKAESNNMGQLSLNDHPSNSLTGGTPSTPRRNSRALVPSDGSPTERRRSIIHQDQSVSDHTMAQQLSRTSTNASSSCSSNGNPFQWDPTPMQSGTPAIPKMSPERKKYHRRQNCIRLSLSTMQAGPLMNSDSSVVMHGIEEEPGSTHKKKPSEEGEIISLDTRTLPRPPSISVFAPEIRLSPTHIRASLAPASPTLYLTKHDQESSDGSLQWRNSGVSGSSAFSIPTYPSPVNTNASQITFTAGPENDTTSGAGHKDDNGALGPRKKDLGYDPVSSLLNYPTLDMPSPKTVKRECRPATPPHSHERKQSQADSPSCSPKTLVIKSQETTPTDPVKRAKAASSPPASSFSTRDPGRSIEISPTRAGLTGPRAEPARDLRKTVAALRRMNSDARDNSRTSQRYRQLGREPTGASLVDNESSSTYPSSATNTSPTKAGRESKASSKSKLNPIVSPSKHCVPASTYSLVSPPLPPPPTSSSHNSTAFSASTAASRTSTATTANTARTTPPPTAPSRSPTRPAFGLGLALGGGVGGGLGCSSASAGSLVLSQHDGAILLGGEDSCTSLTDLILTGSENIFGRRELEIANSGDFEGVVGKVAGMERPGSRVWEDGEGFWESPSTRERERVMARADGGSPDVYETPMVRSKAKGGGGCDGGEQESFDSDAENRTPSGAKGKGKTRAGAVGARGREVLAPKVLSSMQPSSEQGTPQSLYDREGFLR
ncbi:hypothetical protein MPH_03927 [Macrophomina phaseolina MS6]|uniref:Uncharacterized protein n=1 Tax=Macrophomina phaseolina (strain MS6) TaxID=1126212 RepID=K2R8P9_MACPH|nr:hypothetical protein MPH_03927 [Macrophomina phaseolina MS6]